MVKSLVHSLAHKYAAATNSKAGNEDDGFKSRLQCEAEDRKSRLQSVVTIAKQKIEEERRLAVPAAGHAESIAPTDTPPPARKE